MSGASSSVAGWFGRLEPARVALSSRRPDDPRLGEVVEFWSGALGALQPGRAVLVGFPQDEGVRRNGGRPGAADAPREIRRRLYHFTPCDGSSGTDLTASPPLDAGDIRPGQDLEASQQALAEVVDGILRAAAVPIVLGGGHETAWGHFLGYAAAKRPVAIINLDAHLDVRPRGAEGGHSGSPFRQAMEHAAHPLEGNRYVCLGAQPQSVSRTHREYLRARGGMVHWADPKVTGGPDALITAFATERQRLATENCHVYVTIDADVVCSADVPGVSAPNAGGVRGTAVAACARLAGMSEQVSSLDLVEINPRLDVDGRSARWGALVIWSFLAGLATREPGKIHGR